MDVTPRRIDLHIDTLVLRGLPGVDAETVAEALREALAEQLAEQTYAPASDRTVAHLRVSPLPPAARSASGGLDGRQFGQSLAHSIHGALAGEAAGAPDASGRT